MRAAGRGRLILPSEIFSPASGGNAKVSRAMIEIRAQGKIKLNP